MSCYTNHKIKKRPSSLPPPCYHRRLVSCYCPSKSCLTPEPKFSRHCLSSYSPLICRPRLEPSLLPPTICIAGPCSQSSKSHCHLSTPKISPPSSCVRFCIRYTNEGLSYYPCYWSNLPKCPSSIC